MKKITLIFVLLAAMLTLAPTVFADQSYHTSRLPLSLTNEGAVAGHTLNNGMVVNIHPNGPVMGAIEEYILNGAKPNTDYEVVWRVLWVGDIPTGAVVDTDNQGNGRGQLQIPRQWQIDSGLSGLDLYIMWVFQSGGVDVFVTDVEFVHID